jgi:hypothetical protein
MREWAEMLHGLDNLPEVAAVVSGYTVNPPANVRSHP